MSDSALTPVSVACPCPGTPHADGDTVFLGPTLSFRAGVLADSKIADIANGSGDPDEVKAVLLETYILDGVKAWTFTDGEGADIEVTPASIRTHLLSNYGLAVIVAEAADGLYAKSVMDPLVRRISASSRPGPTNGSTSATSASSGGRRTRSKRSSISTSPTAGTGTT